VSGGIRVVLDELASCIHLAHDHYHPSSRYELVVAVAVSPTRRVDFLHPTASRFSGWPGELFTMRGPGIFRQTAKRRLDEEIEAGQRLAGRHDGALQAFDRLLWQARTRTRLLYCSDRAGGNFGYALVPLLAMAIHHADWLRPAETWSPSSGSGWHLCSSLAHHLFALYPVPPFMISAWFELPLGEILPQQRWYKHLGLGRNIRKALLPLRLTRAMAHLFTGSPHHYTAIAALRRAQVRGLGGSESLARAVVETRLGRELGNEDFWESVISFFVNHPALDRALIGPIVDFLQHQKFEWRQGVSPEGEFGSQPPPNPDYAIKGRTVSSVRRHMDDWHRQRAEEGRHPSRSWTHSPVEDFHLVEESDVSGTARVWTINELLSSHALVVEGRAMRHCVADYTDRCFHRVTSIWSMQVENRDGRHRALTLEVDLPRQTICQIRGRHNRMPSTREREVIGRWADREGLAVAEAVRQ
jgi:hypothetical protein